MTVSELRDFYKVQNNAQLAKIIKHGRSTVHGWDANGIPPKTQALFELRTGGLVKANHQALIA